MAINKDHVTKVEICNSVRELTGTDLTNEEIYRIVKAYFNSIPVLMERHGEFQDNFAAYRYNRKGRKLLRKKLHDLLMKNLV